MQTPDSGIAAVAYGPSSVRTRIGSVPVTITEETSYPFGGVIRFHIRPDSPCAFPLKLRVPAWADGAELCVNGEAPRTTDAGSFAEIRRRWTAGDTVTMTFPMPARCSHWYRDSIAVERGPIVYSLPIGADWLKLTDRGQASDWQAYPTTPWNYALALDSDRPEVGLTVHENPSDSGVFTLAETPVRITASAFLIPQWRAQDGVADSMPTSPVVRADGDDITTVSLVPYAAAKLRITAFPHGRPRAEAGVPTSATEAGSK